MLSKYFIIVSVICAGAKIEANPLERIKRSVDNEAPSLPLVNYDNKDYYVQSIFKGNYFQAMQFCRYHGMRLLSITSKKEHEFIEKKIIDLGLTNHHFWTSGTILPAPNPWIWMATGNSFNFTHWDIGEPTATAGDEKSPEQCLEIRIVRGRLWWNDLNCKGLLGFICEIPLNDGSSSRWSIVPPIA